MFHELSYLFMVSPLLFSVSFVFWFSWFPFGPWFKNVVSVAIVVTISVVVTEMMRLPPYMSQDYEIIHEST